MVLVKQQSPINLITVLENHLHVIHAPHTNEENFFYNFNMATACDRFVIGSTTKFLVAYVLPDLFKTLGRWSLDSF